MRNEVREFFAVTGTSIYHVRAKNPERHNYPSAQKVAMKVLSRVGVGEYLDSGELLAICGQLRMYTPEGGGGTSFERRIEMVNTQWWGDHSSLIVALFKTREEADACLASEDLKPCDPRWEQETREVIARIGDNHRSFYVCRFPGLCLAFLAN